LASCEDSYQGINPNIDDRLPTSLASLKHGLFGTNRCESYDR
jgi:hypothetical protein